LISGCEVVLSWSNLKLAKFSKAHVPSYLYPCTFTALDFKHSN